MSPGDCFSSTGAINILHLAEEREEECKGVERCWIKDVMVGGRIVGMFHRSRELKNKVTL